MVERFIYCGNLSFDDADSEDDDVSSTLFLPSRHFC